MGGRQAKNNLSPNRREQTRGYQRGVGCVKGTKSAFIIISAESWMGLDYCVVHPKLM